MVKRLELQGKKFGRLEVIENSGSNRHGKSLWSCRCECGTVIITTSGDLTSGNTNSCGCYKVDRISEVVSTHKMSKSSEYRNWADMLKRCFNPNNKCYKDYAERGISVHKDFVGNFATWFAEIGAKPQDNQRWSVGRIDNNDWYTYGNIRWEIDTQQARNHSKQINNTSGVTGVSQRVSKTGKTSFTAQWVDLSGKRFTKSFSEVAYGYDEAKRLAIEHRLEKIKELNQLGAGYAKSHGADK